HECQPGRRDLALPVTLRPSVGSFAGDVEWAPVVGGAAGGGVAGGLPPAALSNGLLSRAERVSLSDPHFVPTISSRSSTPRACNSPPRDRRRQSRSLPAPGTASARQWMIRRAPPGCRACPQVSESRTAPPPWRTSRRRECATAQTALC